jgi:hypothetical protein
VLDEPLAQFDRLLRDIQVALVPDREPAPPARSRPRPPAPTNAEPEPEPPPEPEPALTPQPPPAPEPRAEPPRGRRGPLAEMLERARPEPPEAASALEPEPGKPGCCHPDLSGELSELADLRASLEELQASLGELLEGYRGALVQSLAASAPRLADPVRAPQFTLVAGPFVAIEAVRAFERTLQALPGIEQVAIRGYEGADRAIVDVRLTEPNS